MLDQCGFPKDDAWYLKAWWTTDTVLHILPHWNWKGREGSPIPVWVYSNCEEVELYLNGKSQGKQSMPRNGHLEWGVPFQPGTLVAAGYKNGKVIAWDSVSTTGDPVSIRLKANKGLLANKEDISIVTVDVTDHQGRHVPTAVNNIYFSLSGPGKIIGVGNGDPTSLEPDKYLPATWLFPLEPVQESKSSGKSTQTITYTSSFTIPSIPANTVFTLYYKSIGKDQSLYINGKEIQQGIRESENTFILDRSVLHPGINRVRIEASPLIKKHSWDVLNKDPGTIQMITPPSGWQRKLFSGLACVMIQSTGEPGQVTLDASAELLTKGTLLIRSEPAPLRAAVGE